VVYLVTKRSFEDVALSVRVGSRLPIFHSAIGRAILVGMTEEARERVFGIAREESAEREADGRRNFAEAKAEYEERGFCSGYGSWRGDVNGIAVPVSSLGGRRVYGLNVGGPSFRVKKKQLETVYAPRLIEAGRVLSMRDTGAGTNSA
jgi:DNA-binding IclR family transcriptional regulator